jgi:hypothetical protein
VAVTGSGGDKHWCLWAAATSIGGNGAAAATGCSGDRQQWQRASVMTGIGNIAVGIQQCGAANLQKKAMADGLTMDWEHCLTMPAEVSAMAMTRWD